MAARGLWRKRLAIFALTLVLGVMLAIGFYLGQLAAYDGMGAEPRSYRAMQEELIAVRSALVAADHERAIQQTRNEVDRQSLELVRKELAGQKEQIAGLEEGLAFYRSLIAPGEIAQGLSLRDIELVAGDGEREFFFRIVVQQEARKHQLLQGEMSIVLAGELGGELVEYPLAELSEDIEAGGLPLRFRYFQSVEGRLTLPEGFSPALVSVVARTTAPRKLEVDKEFPWQLDERFTHVGK